MNTQNTHSCIKCKTQYQSSDVEAYYCDKCNTERLAIAKTIDAKYPTANQVPHSDLTVYDAAIKVRGFVPTKL